ncbi:2-C-methyl-D-erythritol 4-phosphate cytidylyltransferase [Acidocella aminolytica]|jgi:2-C-methyl-D-erythritol 4-phosphate cytidylyltransferase|uniref:2-C-methyl-D-erythritol 4-phosphate cytidylyltransferase n=1 Tax=Acidocella aminolytica 101 = DSM 11237 TaxID=1120923 RepID=A0A0D6PFZ1_9PROT|nr:2-C-methyl-D-erythritol 4-phosphate cytidylyltransferase [Acidocella aminolytica]GAN80291.1 2-C-methyl-D-erythritol 4-phosphate cytidylyltransferase [Acidocella aminolytica 101 = DSM 11237]GBQ44801.1 4-diphosphocytidyl-2-methyl-D-erithritol synthase [Acidocella aminolytica 101 = DSM 11237]SHE93646.1 2-C-methyl-D-erythritol 4-phosphate cytidylyltransferase [Acidocella aminolytica 101 = DSM 11237]
MNIALIVAAGRGYRVGGPLPKQYLKLAGQPILRHTIQALTRHPAIDAVQVLIHPDDQALYDSATEGLEKLLPVRFGGKERQDSVRLGLEAISGLNPDKVLIHDAVRPFIAEETIFAVLEILARGHAAIVGVKLADTLKRVENDVVTGTVSRVGLWRAQTPQGFQFQDILRAHRHAVLTAPEMDFTDDAMIAEHAGLRVEMVEGTEDNFKITTPADLARAEAMLQG